MIEVAFGRFAAFLTRNRLLTGAVYAALCAAIVAGAARLEVDFSARAFFGGDGVATANLERFQAVFGPDDNVVVVLAEADDLLTTPRLDRVHDLVAALGRTEGIDRVLAFTDVPLPAADPAGALAFRPIDRQVPEAPLLRSAWRSRLLRDPDVVPALLSRDGKKAALALTFGERAREGAVSPDDIAAVRHLVQRVEQVTRTLEGDGVRFSLTGTPVVRAALLDLILHDQVVFVPVSFGIMALLLLLLYRRFFGVVLPLIGAALPAALVMGVMGYLGEPIGVVNQVYFTLLPVIAVSGAIHLLSRYYFEAKRLGVDAQTLRPVRRHEAVVEAVSRAGGACLFSALTTVIGLFSLQLSSMPILRNFGLFSGLGVAFAFLALVVLLPLVISTTRGRTLEKSPGGEGGRIDALLGAVADVGLKHPWPITGLAVLGLLGALALAQQVVVDNTLSGLLEPDHSASRAARALDTDLAGLVALEVMVEGEPGVLQDPAVMRALARLEARAAQAEPVRAVQGPAALLRRLNEALTGEASLPADKPATAQLWFLAEGYPLLRDVVDDKLARARISVRSADVGCNRFVALEEELQEAFTHILAEEGLSSRLTLLVTGTPLTSYLGVNRLADDMKRSVLFAFLIIMCVMTAVFRSLRLGLVALLPNALPLALGAALLPALGWYLEPGPAVVFTVAIGIAVDDTIHLLFRFREARADGDGTDAAIRRAVVQSGRPVVITTVILCAGFAINMGSAFPTNARVGALGAFVIGTALLADLFVLPAVLKLAYRSAESPRGGSHTHTDRDGGHT